MPIVAGANISPGLAACSGNPPGTSCSNCSSHAGAEVPQTIAQRWVSILENRGLVIGEGDYIGLSATTCAGMADYFRKS